MHHLQGQPQSLPDLSPSNEASRESLLESVSDQAEQQRMLDSLTRTPEMPPSGDSEASGLGGEEGSGEMQEEAGEEAGLGGVEGEPERSALKAVGSLNCACWIEACGHHCVSRAVRQDPPADWKRVLVMVPCHSMGTGARGGGEDIEKVLKRHPAQLLVVCWS